MFRWLIAVLGIVLMSGCATVSNTPLTPEASMQLKGKSVTRTEYPKADFASFTAGKAMFGVLGAAVMIAEGNSIVRENEIADPAVAIGQKLAEKLSASRGMAVAAGHPTDNDAVSELVNAYPGSNYLLDVKTFNWSMIYYPSDWAHYKVMYSARVRLIDSASKNVIAETMCRTAQGDDNNPPTKDQLLENKAALLKSYLDKGVVQCVDLLGKEMLRL